MSHLVLLGIALSILDVIIAVTILVGFSIALHELAVVLLVVELVTSLSICGSSSLWLIHLVRRESLLLLLRELLRVIALELLILLLLLVVLITSQLTSLLWLQSTLIHTTVRLLRVN